MTSLLEPEPTRFVDFLKQHKYDEAKIMSTIDAMAELKTAGYEYVK